MVRHPDQRLSSGCQPFHVISIRLASHQADAPLIPDAYVYLLDVQYGQYPVSLPDDLAGYTFPLYNSLTVQSHSEGSTESVRAPGTLDLMTLSETEPARAGLRIAHNVEHRLACASFGPLLLYIIPS